MAPRNVTMMEVDDEDELLPSASPQRLHPSSPAILMEVDTSGASRDAPPPHLPYFHASRSPGAYRPVADTSAACPQTIDPATVNVDQYGSPSLITASRHASTSQGRSSRGHGSDSDPYRQGLPAFGSALPDASSSQASRRTANGDGPSLHWQSHLPYRPQAPPQGPIAGPSRTVSAPLFTVHCSPVHFNTLLPVSASLTLPMLRASYELISVLPAGFAPAPSDADVVEVSCSDVAAFVSGFTYITVPQLQALARQHTLPLQATKEDARETLQAHKCNIACSGYTARYMFRRLRRDRRSDPASIMNIVFSNEHGPQTPGAVRMWTLNKYFKFKGCGSVEALYNSAADSSFVVCRTSEISRVVAMYSALSVADLRKICEAHRLPFMHRKPNLLNAIMRHVCEIDCPADGLLFEQLQESRKGPFNVRSIPDPVPDTAPTFSSVDDVRVLPMVLNNDIVVDPLDGQTYVSTYKLNRCCDFGGVLTQAVAQTLHAEDMETAYLAAHTLDISAFVSLYSFMTIKQLREIGFYHGITVKKTSKPALLSALLAHRCSPGCAGSLQPLLFRIRRTPREIVPGARTVASVKTAETHRKALVQKTQAAKQAGVSPKAKTSDEKRVAVHAAVQHARQSFPYMCPISNQRDIVNTWQTDLDPPKWLPLPCAVCGRSTVRKLLTAENPLDYDLTLLQNPCLPHETLPTTYNFDAYDRAILCPAAMRDRERKAVIDMCTSCKTVLLKRLQPLDALANFQYYARDELPPDVKAAFSSASLYDLMMVSRSRATRITHMFCEKPSATGYEKVRESSQGYSKGNVAILAQDVAVVRPMLPPPRAEVNESMCALFVGCSTVPTRDNIKDLRPVLVSKTRVQRMLEFLLTKNPQYVNAGVQYSQENLDAMYPENADEAVPSAIQLYALPDAVDPNPSGYADRGDAASTERDVTGQVDVDIDDGTLVLEAVGYATGEKTPQGQRGMKAAAVAWCLEKKSFIKMQTGSKFITDRDPGLLTFTFPGLDPWGIGGFHEPNRTDAQQISFERQTRNLLLQHDRVFQKDPNFAYICWNIMQKKEINRHVTFRTNASSHATIVSEIENMAPLLPDLMKKWELNPNAKASNKAEKRAMRTLNKLKIMAKDLRGSSGYKQCRRNEIRAMMKKMATPALFTTINPADICDPLLGAMAGVEPEEWANMTATARRIFIAANPGPAALFFDEVIKSFIRIILKYNPKSDTEQENGLFGRCRGYYGMVEAQGRGTLHCHMLIWIEGNPTPQELRDRMKDSPEFQDKMFAWLESIIKCELPSTTGPVIETDGALKPPGLPAGRSDPRLTKEPRVADMTDEEFVAAFRETVEDIVTLSNWHDHRPGCWKHLKNGEVRNDDSCRMRIDGSINPFTHVDPETESIMLRRLHPRINNYNELIIFLLRCNMDIKYVGSGEAAKALVYYVTDYITKGTLPTHVGLAALEYAIKMNSQKYDPEKGPRHVQEDVNRSLFTKTIMALMSKQEMSHQQVMSYLIGGGDCYVSHAFKIVKWGEFDRLIAKQEQSAGPVEDVACVDGHTEPSATLGSNNNSTVNETGPSASPCEEGEESDGEDENDGPDLEQLTVVVNDNYVGIANKVQDYPFRSREPAFDRLCLWDHEEQVIKISKAKEDKRLERLAERQADRDAMAVLDDEDDEVDAAGDAKFGGKKAELRGQYAVGHGDIDTHLSRFRETPVVNVLLGDRIPRPDRGLAEKDKWCRAMLILFKPWRTLRDLKSPDCSWTAAYQQTEFADSARAIMTNMNIENECKDARDKYEVLRRAGKVRPLLPGGDNVNSTDVESLTNALGADSSLDAEFPGPEDNDSDLDIDGEDEDPAVKAARETYATKAEKEVLRVLSGLQLWKSRAKPSVPFADDENTLLSSAEDKVLIARHAAHMKEIGKNKRPAAKPLDPIRPTKRRRLDADCVREPKTSVDKLNFISETIYTRGSGFDHVSPEQHLEDVIEELGIEDNVEQLRALRIIAEHFIFGMEQQLLLYIAGVGGAGKSFVIKAVVEFFRRCGVSDAMLLSAPTGCAAVLIDGFTIHALTFLPKKKDEKPGSRSADLAGIWKDIRYLVIDEISMVSADLLASICARLNEGCAMKTEGTDNMFGRINIILLGDMGQLRPVLAQSLFSHELVAHISPGTRETCTGVDAMYGAWIWREFKKVVILRKNFRARNDPEYTNLLARVRLGLAWDGRTPMTQEQRGDGRNFPTSDFQTIHRRQLQGLPPNEQQLFANAPIICAAKVVRDLVNRELTQDFANRAGTAMHDYHAQDSFNGLPLNDDMQVRTWQIRSSKTKDSLGRLPLAVGMKVMVTDNIATSASVVNGAEGILRKIMYSTDRKGRRYADCAYVEIPGASVAVQGLPPNIVPIVPQKTYVKYTSVAGLKFTISRLQLPLLPSYAYTDYKSQGRSLERAIVDLSGCRSLQSFYVMLSRATSLKSVAVLRAFNSRTMCGRLGEDFRREFQRLEALDAETTREWEAAKIMSAEDFDVY